MGCSSLYNDSRIIIENDIVKSSRRIRKEYYYNRPIERRTNLNFVKQTILKEISDSSGISYTFFDVLSLTSDAYNPEDKVFLIIDNEIIPISVQLNESIMIDEIKKEEGSILTSDSTEMTVITGYTPLHNKIIKLRYSVPPDIMNKIVSCTILQFRYYSGPHKITIKLKGNRLKKLKKIVLFE